MRDQLDQLKALLARGIDLTYAAFLLSWDQETKMPPGGVQARADQIATLQSLAHEFFTADAVGALLDELAPYADSLPHDSHEASLIRVTRRDYEKRRRVPAALVGELARASALGKKAWAEAKAGDDFAHFQPHLERIVALRIQWAECFAPFADRYDPLLDHFEPGLDTPQIAAVFEALKPELVTLVAAIAERRAAVDDRVLHVTLPDEAQIAFCRQVTEWLGYDYQRGRLDLSAHPFTTRFSMDDVRITTRILPGNPIKALMSAIHEAGHALHAQHIDRALYRTGLDVGLMMAISESQSRFYENVLGRSRAFWRFLFPRFQRAFAPHFDAADAETLYRAVNRVEPGLTRVEADEVTYGLHIMLRFELEHDLINERVRVADLPREWNDRMEAYLGVRPTTDREGVLQDIHWSQGAFGYFPDYLLGSILAAQLWARMQEEIPEVEAQIGRGEFGPILHWLSEKVMRHGRKFTLPELAQRATGGPLSSGPYVAYLRGRYGEIYGV